jgi:Cdc6-like AAA superfamily ATPase
LAILEYETAQLLSVNAAKVFQPRSPITTRELFAGRWSELTTIADAVHQVGLHAIIYGERGVGKTSLSNVVKPTIWALDGGKEQDVHRLVVKAVTASGDSFASIWEKLFREITWQDNKPFIGLIPSQKPAKTLVDAFSLEGKLTVDMVRRVLVSLPRSVFIIDEFDRAASATSQEFSDLIKALSDFAVDVTVVLVGVAETVDKLISDHASVSRALIQVLLPRMKADELRAIITNAEKSLDVTFSAEAADLIVKMSQGLPHYTHLIGLNAVRTAALERYSNHVDRADVFQALQLAVKHAEQSTANKYSKATHSAQTDALYRQVLLACAITATKAHDALGYFNPAAVTAPLAAILRKNVAVATYNNHLSEFIQLKRGQVLERDGQSRGYRYRFHDPLLVPFVFMTSVASGLITAENLMELVS